MNDPSWSPMNSAARQLVHVEAGRGVRTVLVGGAVVVRDRKLTSVDETTIYEAVKAVMPEFRKDFAVISARVAKLQPWLDRAHKQIMGAELDIERNPRIEVLDATTGRAIGCLQRAGLVDVIQKEALQIVDVEQPGIGERLKSERVRRSSDGQGAIGELLEAQEGGEAVRVVFH